MENYQIHKAALESDYEYALKLIQLHVNLNELDTYGHTALHWAVFRGDLELVQILLEAGADPNIISGDGVTPTWRASDFGLIEIEKILRSYSGNIATNEAFDRTSFSIFNSAIGQPLPEEEPLNQIEGNAKAPDKKRWWKF